MIIDREIGGTGLGAIALLPLLVLFPGSGWSQSVCEEPADAAYVERMDEGRAAVEEAHFEEALTHFEWARAHYDYAVIDYGIARALHHLEQFAEAQVEYNNFLRHHQGCADPFGLRPRAQEYLALAIQQERTAIDLLGAEHDEEALGVDPAPAGGGPDDGIHPGWIVMAGGGGLILTGFILDLAYLSVRDEKEQAAEAGDVERFNQLDQQLDNVVIAEYVLFGVGLAALTTGAVLLILDGDDDAPDAPALSVGLAPTRGGTLLQLGGAF